MDEQRATEKVMKAGEHLAFAVNELWGVYMITGDEFFKRYSTRFHDLTQELIMEGKALPSNVFRLPPQEQ